MATQTTAPDPETLEKPKRRFFTAAFKAKILALTGPVSPCHALPSTAVRSSARVDPALEILARAADELARPTTGRMRSIREEVRRDRLVAVAALMQETLACVGEEIERLMVDECPPDPAGLHERLTERLDVLGRQSRRSRHADISRATAATSPLIPAVHPVDAGSSARAASRRSISSMVL